jgi:ABC-type iron transport system FetAB ATPase subunit
VTLYFTNDDQQQYEDKLKQVHAHSRLGFLNAHNGLRRASLHLVLGTTGGGKSTLVRTLLRDIIFNPQNELSVGIWLSEETVDDYKRQVAYGMPSHDKLLTTNAYSELDSKIVSEMTFFEWLEFYRPDVLIFDNITTSALYNDKTAKEQGSFSKKLKEATTRLNIATIIIAHTDAKATDSMGRLINLNDIRGSKNLANLVEFAYILQRFEVNDGFYPTIRVVKHRSQELVHGLYFLQYDKRIRSFSGDLAIDFKKFKEMYTQRNRLDK